MKNDIQINGNIIGGRQGWAYICNSMKFAVLKANMDKEQKYEDFKTFGNVRVAWNGLQGHELIAVGTLEVESGKWSIGGHGCCIKASFGFDDMVKSIEESNLQVIRKDDIIAVATFSNKIEFAWLSLFKVSSINSNCTTMAELIPLNEDEMAEIKKDAERWCNR